MNIEWTNCSDWMPPDDETKIIVMYGGVMIDRFTSNIFHAACELSKKVNGETDIKWTEFTKEKWEFLNR